MQIWQIIEGLCTQATGNADIVVRFLLPSLLSSLKLHVFSSQVQQACCKVLSSLLSGNIAESACILTPEVVQVRNPSAVSCVTRSTHILPVYFFLAASAHCCRRAPGFGGCSSHRVTTSLARQLGRPRCSDGAQQICTRGSDASNQVLIVLQTWKSPDSESDHSLLFSRTVFWDRKSTCPSPVWLCLLTAFSTLFESTRRTARLSLRLLACSFS